METTDKDEESSNGVKWKPRYDMNPYVWWLFFTLKKMETAQSGTDDGLLFFENNITY